MKTALIILFLSLIGLLVADKSGLLGSAENAYVDYFDVEFLAEDDTSGEKIMDFVANCSRKGSQNACSIEQGWNKHSRRIKFGIVRQQVKSWFFTLSESIVGIDNVDVAIMFIHPDYERHSEIYSLRNLLALENQQVIVPLTKQQGNTNNE